VLDYSGRETAPPLGSTKEDTRGCWKTLWVKAEGAGVWTDPTLEPPSGQTLPQIPAGTRLQAIRRLEDWYEIAPPPGVTLPEPDRSEGESLFVRADQVDLGEGRAVYILEPETKLMPQRTFSSLVDPIAVFSPGQAVLVLQEADGWFRVQAGDISGWIRSEQASFDPPEGVPEAVLPPPTTAPVRIEDEGVDVPLLPGPKTSP
jgi:hypothetical protein